MKMRKSRMRQIALILLMSVLCGCVEQKTRSEKSPPDDLSASGIHWQDWSPAAFEQADREKKLVLLHLGAGWCHWCHVMEHETYRDPQVVALIEAHYIAIHVDQDS